ncbi:hypothetical protein [Streptomyces hydrogenans]|uniref:hypothetical protein n=1 Tax=Streptomyces hydrogenans TaxID=1873719 RepID=UPI0034330E66
MRPLASRRLTALAISAAITLGTAGPAVAGELHPSSAADRAAHAPLPDAAALLTQTKALADVGGVTTPVTELVTAALEADGGQVPAADAESLKARIQAAVDRAKETAPAPVPETPALPEPPVTPPAVDTPVTPPAVDTPVTPPAVDAPVTPPAVDAPVTPPAVDAPVAPPAVDAPVAPPAVEAPVVPPAVETPAGLPVKPPVTLPVAAGAAAVKAGRAAPADLVDDALATVEKAVAGLLAAVTSGDAAGVVPQVTATLTSLVNLAVATVLGSGLPAPDLAGLPALPALPVEPPELPVDPPVEAPELPVDAPVKPPVSAPELPVKPPLPVR